MSSILSPFKAAPAPASTEDDEENDEIEAYLEWEEEVNTMSNAELKESLMVREMEGEREIRVGRPVILVCVCLAGP